MSHRQNAAGFTSLESLIAIGIVLLIFLVGWGVYTHYYNSNSAQILHRQEYIDKYITLKASQKYSATYYNGLLYRQGYITSSLYHAVQTYITDENADTSDTSTIITNITKCIGQIPDSYQYGVVSVSSDGDTATIPVKVFEFGSNTPIPVTANWVNTDGSWQLNSAGCAQ